MQKNQKPMRPVPWLWVVVGALLVAGALLPSQALAQMPARFYWKSLAGAEAVPFIFESLSGNTNPFDSSHLVTPGAQFDAELVLAGWARTFALKNRAAMTAFIMPMGRVSGDVTVAGKTAHQSSSGFGDPMIEFDVNLVGPPAQKNLVDALRYEPGFSLDFLLDLALPLGEYDDDQPLNLGQNRFYGRIGAPIVWQLGSWVPGRRRTLEFLPAMWLFADNDDFVGQTMETDPLFQLDAHYTRDFNEHLWGAIDGTWYYGGAATIGGTEGDKLNNIGLGFTIGYQVNDNLALTTGYKSTVADDDPEDLRMDNFMVSLVYGWHEIIEGSKRLKGEE